jgi:glycosyltransferase involved in cell wall biosynthesis
MLLASTYVTDPRVRNEAESLRDRGYKVTVLSWDRSGKQPRNYDSEGVSVVSFKILRGTTFSKVRFAFAAVLFQLACVSWCAKNARKDSIIIHSHDFNTLAAAVFLKILHPGARLIYDSHELTPAAFSEWYGSKMGALAGAIERSFLPFVDRVITVSPPIEKYLSSVFDKPVFLLYNTIRLSDVPKQDKEWWRSRCGLNGSFVVSYVGSLREDTAVENLIEAARKCAASSSDVRFVVVGDGSRLEQLKAQAAGTEEYLEFLPRVSHDVALGFVKASDITFAVYKNLGDNTKIAMPWKVFESMACGTPVLVRDGTYTWRFVNNLGVGLSAGSGSPEEISERIIWALKHRDSLQSISNEGRKNFVSKFNWDNMSRVLLEAYGN